MAEEKSIPAKWELATRTPEPAPAEAAWSRLWAAAPAEVRQQLGADRGLARALLQLLASSEFLAEALVQAPELVPWLAEERRAGPGRPRDAWASALAAATAAVAGGERTRALIRFKRREYLRIALRDLEGQASLAETTQDLSHLADAVLQQAYVWAWNDLAQRHGIPKLSDGSGAEMAVMGLGKLGGGELNYSSDIDLMFLYRGEGETAGGGRSTSNHEFFTRLAQAIVGYVSGVTSEGPAYRVDLRLRPGGREGEVALALGQAVKYYGSQARDWELQMLLRARGCAGSERLAGRFLEAVEAWVYPPQPDAGKLAEGVRDARRRISAQLDRHRALGRRGPGVDVKLDAGGIRDIEFLAQYLQRLHGGRDAWVRSGHTLIAMQRLHDKGWLAGAEFQQLASAYWLLRQLEHRLQLRLGQQTHTLPTQAERLHGLARSLAQAEGAPSHGWSGAELETWVKQRMAEVRRCYQLHLGSEAAAVAPAGHAVSGAGGGAEALPDYGWNLRLGAHGRRQWQRLRRSAATDAESERGLRALPEAALPRLELALEQSDWMAEALIRRPVLVDALETSPRLPSDAGSLTEGMAALRAWHQRQTLRLLWAEWARRAPIATTLAAHSGLAVEAVAWGLRLAQAAAPAVSAFAVLALGRLGLGELDLLSDLDLVFVALPQEREAATRLAAKLIEVLTAHTQQGSLYPVDTRLRPGGGEGELVQTPESLAEYFGRRAGLWEAVSYLKARPVAGDPHLGLQALEAVGQALAGRFRRGMQSAAARQELEALRDRMEREGRPGRWGLKTAAGGYYDVDFLASRRWLQLGRQAGRARGLAGWVEAMPASSLPRNIGGELVELTLYLRAADHALRVATGKAGAAVPAGGEGTERAWRWLQRILPAGVASDANGVDNARRRIRAIYQEWK